MEDKELLRRLIEIYLQINTQPSDEQFHNLARSVNQDPESLEAIAYDMLSEDVNGEGEVDAVSTHFPNTEEEEDFGLVNASVRLLAGEEVTHEGGGTGEEGLSQQQEVLQGEGDPDTTPTDDLVLTDGAPEGTTTDDEMQDSLLVDGVGEDDTGVGIESDKSMLLNDGAPALQLQNAATRLAASFSKIIAAPSEKEIFGIPAAHLSKRRGTAEQLGQAADQKPNKIVGVVISSPKGKQGFWFLGGAAGLKLGSPIRFKGTRGKVDFMGDVKKDGSVSTRDKNSIYVSDEVRPFYVFK